MNKVQVTKAIKGGALDEDEDAGPPPVLDMEFTVVDMGMHFVEVDQTPLKEDQVITQLLALCPPSVYVDKPIALNKACGRRPSTSPEQRMSSSA